MENAHRPKSRAGRKPKPRLTIGIDCGSLSSSDERARGGIATITRELLSQLAILDKKNSYILYSFAKLDSKIATKFSSARNSVLWPPLGYQKIRLPQAMKSDHVHVFLGLSQAVPQSSARSIGFIYDVAFTHLPQLYENATKLTEQTREVIERSQHIVTTSHASKADVIKHFDSAAEKISVIHPGVSDEFTPNGPRLIGNVPYFLFVGQLKLIKNVPRIITAFKEFLDRTGQKYRLILIGSDLQKDPQIDKTIAALHLGDVVVQEGYVTDEKLPKYFRGATALIYPSLYEGFGLPILEAMACGCPVIAGNNSSMIEIVGTGGILVNAKKSGEIADAMEQVAIDIKLRKKLIKIGIHQAKKFSWRVFANEIVDTIYQVSQKAR